jgi:hypothetical protein
LDWAIGTQRLWRAAPVGALAGLAAAVAYDVFRLPFVYSGKTKFFRKVGVSHFNCLAVPKPR